MAATGLRAYGRGMSRCLAFMGMSLDGCIAGPKDELDWLSADGAEDTFTPFFAQIGAMLMGRRTYDVVAAMDVPWPYGETPVLVATSRELTGGPDTVRPVAGTIGEVIEQAKAAAGDRDVYIDGGALVRSALVAGLVDEVTLSVVPIALGNGIGLFRELSRHVKLELLGARPLGGGLVELRYRPLS